MTVSVKQAWAALLPDRGKADAPRRNGKGDETAFSEAVKLGAPGKQARRPTADAAGEPRRPGWNVEINLPDKAVGEPHAAGANHAHYPWERPVGLPDIVADRRDADGHEDPKAAEARAVPEERTETASETMPVALRPPLPPSILLGGFEPETGAASDGDLTSSTAPASLQADTAAQPPSAPVKADATLAKTAVVTPPAVAAAETTVAPPTAAHAPKINGQEVEPRPLPASLGEPAMKPPAGAQSGAVSTNEITKPVVAESAARPDAAAPSTIIARDWSREKNVPDVPGQAAPVTVLARQNAPAPATPFPGLTAPLLTAIAADRSWRELAAAADLHALPAQNAVASAHSLKVQLHPAELGMVTASLRFAGEQLTVELQVESVEAQQRLSADTDTIVKSLRALGLEVDRVTIQQSLVVQASNARADTNAGQNGQPAPDRQSFSAANSGGGNGQAGGHHSGRNPSNGAQASQNTARGSEDRAGGGLYI